jgi:L-fuculose-phosphate aldolase
MDISGKYKPERKEIARFMRRLYRHGLTTTSGGNVSRRITDDIIGITPSATDKGDMRWEEVGLVSTDGKNLTPALKPSIETAMHLAIYKIKKDAHGIVHAHPVFATAFTAMQNRISTDLTAEARAILGDPLFVPYALMGTLQLAGLVAESITKSDILLLENHGILTVGTDILQAFDRIEVLENAAKMTLIVGIMGKKSPLTQARIMEIDKLFR